MNKTLSVFDSNTSINGMHIIVGLGKNSVKLPCGTILSSTDGKQWKVMDNDLKFGQRIMKLIKEKEAEGISFYDLQGIGHMHKPDVGEELTITQSF